MPRPSRRLRARVSRRESDKSARPTFEHGFATFPVAKGPGFLLSAAAVTTALLLLRPVAQEGVGAVIYDFAQPGPLHDYDLSAAVLSLVSAAVQTFHHRLGTAYLLPIVVWAFTLPFAAGALKPAADSPESR